MLADRVPSRPGTPPDELLDLFLGHVRELGIELYPAQEQAILELCSGNNVILATPTGSGKSLVALAMHFLALSEGKRSFYTAPIKALVSDLPANDVPSHLAHAHIDDIEAVASLVLQLAAPWP